jgi:hypothetical protein
MKTSIKWLAVLGGLALLLSVASASSINATIARADVPFAFVVNGTYYASGQYQFEVGHWNGVIVLVDPSGSKHLMTVTPLGNPYKPVDTPRLSFIRTGAGMTLSEVWVNGGTGGHKLPTPKPQTTDKVEIALARL